MNKKKRLITTTSICCTTVLFISVAVQIYTVSHSTSIAKTPLLNLLGSILSMGQNTTAPLAGNDSYFGFSWTVAPSTTQTPTTWDSMNTTDAVTDTTTNTFLDTAPSTVRSGCNELHSVQLNSCAQTFNSEKAYCEATYTACSQGAANNAELNECLNNANTCLQNVYNNNILCESQANTTLQTCNNGAEGQNTSPTSSQPATPSCNDQYEVDMDACARQEERDKLDCSDTRKNCTESCEINWPWPLEIPCINNCIQAELACFLSAYPRDCHWQAELNKLKCEDAKAVLDPSDTCGIAQMSGYANCNTAHDNDQARCATDYTACIQNEDEDTCDLNRYYCTQNAQGNYKSCRESVTKEHDECVAKSSAVSTSSTSIDSYPTSYTSSNSSYGYSYPTSYTSSNSSYGYSYPTSYASTSSYGFFMKPFN